MNDVKLARGLGWFSIGLGLAEVVAPRKVGRVLGIERPRLMRALGVRELMTGIGALTERRPNVSMWARVAGDVIDVAVLTTTLREETSRRSRLGAAIGVLLGVGVLDLLTARRLST